MDEKNIDLIELKKKILVPHLKFVEMMLSKVKGTNLEEKWKIMHECITSDKKKPSYEKIRQIEKTLITLKIRSQQRIDSSLNNSKSSSNTDEIPSTSRTIFNPVSRIESKGINLERDPRKRPVNSQKIICESGVFNPQGTSKFQIQQKLERNPNSSEKIFTKNNSDMTRRSLPIQSRDNFKIRQDIKDERQQKVIEFKNDNRYKQVRSHSPGSFHDRSQSMLKKRKFEEIGKIPERSNRNYTEEDCAQMQASAGSSKHFLNEKNKFENKDREIEITIPAKHINSLKSVNHKFISATTISNALNKVNDLKLQKQQTVRNITVANSQNLNDAIKKIQSFKMPNVDSDKNDEKSQKDDDSFIQSSNSIERIELANLSSETSDFEIEVIDEISTDDSIETETDNSQDDRDEEESNVDLNIPRVEKDQEKIIQDIKENKIERNELDLDKIDQYGSNTSSSKEIKGNELSNTEKNNIEELVSKFEYPLIIAEEKKSEKPCKTESSDSNIIKEFGVKNKQINKSEITSEETRNEESKVPKRDPKISENSQLNSSIVETKCKTANILTSLLENEEDNPEKLLEGLFSAFGAEKVKKMQELLLKNTIKPTEEQNDIENANFKDIVNEDLPNEAELNSVKEGTNFDDQKESNTISRNQERSSTNLNQHQILVQDEMIDKNLNCSMVKENELCKTQTLIPTSSNNCNSTNQRNSDLNISTVSGEAQLFVTPEISDSILVNNSPNPSPLKKQRKKPKKKLSELDKLHHDILVSHDYEGILKACTQPRVSTKTKLYKGYVPNENIAFNRKVFENTEPKVKLVRLDLTVDDMPVIVNDEFMKKSIINNEPKYKPGPLSSKIRIQNKSNNPLILDPKPKLEYDPPISSVNETIKKDEMKIETVEPIKIKVVTKVAPAKKGTKPIQRKKRKNLLWSKGILKKKPKRFKSFLMSEWEDVDSSDDNISYESSIKLEKFYDLFNKFASKCIYNMKIKKKYRKNERKLSACYNASESVFKNETQKQISEPANEEKLEIQFVNRNETTIENNIEQSYKSSQNSTDGLNSKDLNITKNPPKRINLPLEKNLLALLSNKMESNQKNKTEISNIKNSVKESKPLNISIKLPVQTPNVSTLPHVNEKSSQENQLKAVSPQIGMVKPISRELPEKIVVRTLSQQEQQALKVALSNAQVINTVDINKLKKVNSSLTINKTSVPRSVQPSEVNSSSSSDTRSHKNIPIITSVASCSKSIDDSRANSVASVQNSIGVKTSPTEKGTNNEDEQSCQSNTSNLKISSIVESSAEFDEIVSAVNSETSDKETEVEIVDLIDDDDDDDFVDILRPWIEKTEFKCRKIETECISMLNNVYCLASLFKCMGSTCRYFTNDKDLFKLHLEFHRDHQNEDSSNFLLCCYCNFRPNNLNVLLTHIETAHGYGKYGCRYCFYRSVNEYQVTANHHMNYHRNKEKCVVVFESRKSKNENIEKNYISETIPKVCPVLACPFCRVRIYTTLEFKAHLQCHQDNLTAVCSECEADTNRSSIIQHFFKCYSKYGDYQCVFCVFGTCNFTSIDNHLSIEHPDKLSYFAERTLNFGKDPTSIEALTIKELSKKITGNVKKVILNYAFNDEIFKNSESYGRISDKLFFNQNINQRDANARVIKKLQSTSSENECSLQINQVMSLRD